MLVLVDLLLLKETHEFPSHDSASCIPSQTLWWTQGLRPWMMLRECLFLSPPLVLMGPCITSCLLQFRFEQAELCTELTEQTDTDGLRRLCTVDTFKIVHSATTKI